MIYYKALLITVFLISCTSEKVKRQTILQVGEQNISVRDFAEELTEELQGTDIIIIKNTQHFDSAKNKILSSFIEQAIVKKYAKENNIIVNKQDLDDAIEKVRSSYPDDISFRASFAEESISFERWQKKIKKNVLEKKVFDDITKNIDDPSEETIKKYYQENRKKFYRKRQFLVKQIVLAKSSDANKLYDQIKKIGSFEKLAMEYSIGAEASRGGLLGWIEEGVSDIFDKAAQLPKRYATKPTQSEFGYHIVLVEKTRPPRQLPISEVEDQIRQELIESSKQEYYIKWFEEQKKQTKVAINESLLKSMTVDLKND